MRGFSLIIGLILVLAGILALLNATGVVQVGWRQMWPIFVLAPGLIFELSYFTRRDKKYAGILVPGGILVTYAVLFFFNAFTQFQWIRLLWPVFILGPAVGLFQLYLTDRKYRNLMVPITILTIISTVFLLVNFASEGIGGIILPLVLIGVGLFILWTYFRNDSRKRSKG